MARALVERWLLLGMLIACPASPLVAQEDSRVAVGPFAGVEFRDQQRPLFGLAGAIPLPRGLAGIVAVSTVRYTGTLQFEAGVRWPGVREALLTPYLGAGACFVRGPLAIDLLGPSTWSVGVLGLAGMELHAWGLRAFVEGVGLTAGGSAVQLRGGLRLQGP